SPVVLSNNKVEVDGIEYAQNCYQFRTAFADLPNIQPGRYYFRLVVNYSSTGTTTYDRTHYEISEPIDVAYKHPGTVLLKVSNATNDYDTIFVQTGFSPAMRTEGAIFDFSPDSESTYFVNQRGASRKLYDRPGSTKTLVIGGGQGVARWIKECAHHLLSADQIAIDGRGITKAGDAQWQQIEVSPNYPLGGMSIPVKYSDPAIQYKTIVRQYTALFTAPAYPYFI